MCSQAKVLAKLYEFGFKKNFIKALLGTQPAHVWDYYEKEYSVQHVIDELVKQIACTNIEAVLTYMRKSSRMLYTEMFKDLKYHYSVIHMIQIIIEYGNGRYNSISPFTFLYNPEIENTLYTYKRNNTNYTYYNASEYDDASDVIQLLNIDTKQYRLYYHATNWDALQDILEDGPDSREGRQCLDFGRTPSFYVTHDIKTAINWCEKKKVNFQKECGIVIFALPIQEYADYKTFTKPNDEWKRLVKDSRMCKKKNELDKYNFVYGPMLENAIEIKQDGVEAREHNPIKWQLASKNLISDLVLKKSMIGAIFKKK